MHHGLPRYLKVLGGKISVGIPILYMIATHISWEGDRNGKLRMALKHAGFWGGLWLTVAAFHNFAFPKKTFKQALPIFLSVSVFPIAGYEVMRRVAARVFPKGPASVQPPRQTTVPSPRLSPIRPPVALPPAPTKQPYAYLATSGSANGPYAPYAVWPVQTPYAYSTMPWRGWG